LLQGKRALVTGSSSGIGEAIAKALAREHVAVVIHGRNYNRIRRVAKTIREESGCTVSLAQGDLSTENGVIRVAKVALDAFGGIDIVVNNAAEFFFDSWTRPEPVKWLDIYNNNVVSMVRIIRHLLPQMRERGWGRFIQISSGAFAVPNARTAAYAATKSAIVNLTVSLAKGLEGTGLTANTISPGYILTPFYDAWIRKVAKKRDWAGERSEMESRFVAEFMPNPARRLGRVEEVADLCVFISSPRADYINGSNFRVDGGWMASAN